MNKSFPLQFKWDTSHKDIQIAINGTLLGENLHFLQEPLLLFGADPDDKPCFYFPQLEYGDVESSVDVLSEDDSIPKKTFKGVQQRAVTRKAKTKVGESDTLIMKWIKNGTTIIPKPETVS